MKYISVKDQRSFDFTCYMCGKTDTFQPGQPGVVLDLDRWIAREPDCYAHTRCLIPTNTEIRDSDPRKDKP